MAASESAAGGTPEFGERYDVVVIGAGIGGLSCGALLARSGLKVLVVEREAGPGGFMTDYERNGFRFQVPHVAAGCGSHGPLTRIINHLGMKVEFKQVQPCMRFIYPEHEVPVPGELSALAWELKESFQPQTENVNRFFHMVSAVAAGYDIRAFRRPRRAGTALGQTFYKMLHPRLAGLLAGKGSYSALLGSYFSDERLRAVLETPWSMLGSPPWELAALPALAMLSGFESGAWFPVGGYGELARAFAGALEKSGGTLLLGHEATAVNTSDGKVSGVELTPRTKVEAGAVVSDADSRRTFLDLCDRESFSRSFLERVEDGPLSVSAFAIHLGMARAVEDPRLAGGPVFVQPTYDHRGMLEQLSAPDRFPDPAAIPFRLMAPSVHDPGLAPAGGSCLEIVVPAVPYGFQKRWGVEAGVRGDRYEKIKERYAEVVIDAVSRVFPDLIGDVVAYDVSTPVTYERYTTAADGCLYDRAQVPGQTSRSRPGPDTPLRGLYVTGSKSVLGGGICSSALSGLLAADSVLGGELDQLF